MCLSSFCFILKSHDMNMLHLLNSLLVSIIRWTCKAVTSCLVTNPPTPVVGSTDVIHVKQAATPQVEGSMDVIHVEQAAIPQAIQHLQNLPWRSAFVFRSFHLPVSRIPIWGWKLENNIKMQMTLHARLERPDREPEIHREPRAKKEYSERPIAESRTQNAQLRALVLHK